MTHDSSRARKANPTFRTLLALACAGVLVPGEASLLAQQPAAAPASAPAEAKRLPPERLDSLVAPIALYPDDLLAQTLAASTYPLEVVQLQQWLARNKGLKDQALVDAVGKQPWDPSVQSMAAFPEVVKRLADDIQWAADLGNAFLAQQADVMEACQRMRKKAMDKGTLASGEQIKVQTKVVETKEVIVIQPASPEVIYVPSYDPVVVYGPAYYPYPPIYYPYYYPGAAWVSFGVGFMFGAMWGGFWGHCGWHGGSIDINVNNNFNRVDHHGGNRGGNWSHNPKHRGGTPYADKRTADRFGGTSRGDSLANRQASARQQMARDTGMGDRAAGYGNRDGSGVSDRAAGGGRAGVSDRPAGSSRGSRGSGSFDRGSTGGGSFGRGGSADRIGSRDLGGGSRGAGGFGGSSGGFSGSRSRASSSRGSSSFGGRGGGGGRRR